MNKIYYIFIVIAFFIYSHVLILYGALKERDSRICISPSEQKRLTDTIDTAKAICVDMAQVRLKEMNDAVAAEKENVAYWKKKAYTPAIVNTSSSSTVN